MKKIIFIDANILCKCCEVPKMLEIFQNESKEHHFVTTDVFWNEFKSQCHRKYTKYIDGLENIKSNFHKVIDCRKTFKKLEFEIDYRDYCMKPPHKLKGRKKTNSNNHNDTLSWITIINYCKNKKTPCKYEFWSNDSDFFAYKSELEKEFNESTKQKISFQTFFPIKIFKSEYEAATMQFEDLHAWFESFNQIINDEVKKKKYEQTCEICNILLKQNNLTKKHPIGTIIDWIKSKNDKYIGINSWFIKFYKRITDKGFLKNLKNKNNKQFYDKNDIKNIIKNFAFLEEIKY